MNRRALFGFELPFLLVAAAAAYPLVATAHPPIEDLPQHLATVRVLVDYDDPALRFREFFTLDLLRTQYLAYYLVVALFAKIFGVVRANTIVLSAVIVATPYAMRSLLRALDRDERGALFVVPLTWNAHLVLGFFNFVAAIPLVLVGLALAIELRKEWSRARAIALAVVAFVCFYTHVVPFAFLGLGAALLAIGDGPRDTVQRLVALVPAGLAGLAWIVSSPAGEATLRAAHGNAAPNAPVPTFTPVAEAMHRAPEWLTDVLHGPRDEQYLAAWAVLALFTIAFATADPSPTESIVRRARRIVAVLPALALVLYFVTPDSYDWIWPINARFPLLALVFLIPSLELPSGPLGHGLAVLLASLSLASSVEVARAFDAVEREEVGLLDEAVGTIPRGSKVVGLIWDRYSQHVKFAPFLHSVGYVQAMRGGAVMFSFADFPASPFRFRDSNRPPRVPPRWEWMPERVNPADLAYYDYALVRGGPGPIGAPGSDFSLVLERAPWRVYRRMGATRSGAMVAPP